MELAALSSNIKTYGSILIKNRQTHLGHLATVIRVLSPENTLNRGYAIVKVDRRITSDPDQLVIGQDVEILLRSTTITATVKSKENYHGKDVDL